MISQCSSNGWEAEEEEVVGTYDELEVAIEVPVE